MAQDNQLKWKKRVEMTNMALPTNKWNLGNKSTRDICKNKEVHKLYSTAQL